MSGLPGLTFRLLAAGCGGSPSSLKDRERITELSSRLGIFTYRAKSRRSENRCTLIALRLQDLHRSDALCDSVLQENEQLRTRINCEPGLYTISRSQLLCAESSQSCRVYVHSTRPVLLTDASTCWDA